MGEEEEVEKEKAGRIIRKSLFKPTNPGKSNEKLANMTVWKRSLASSGRLTAGLRLCGRDEVRKEGLDGRSVPCALSCV